MIRTLTLIALILGPVLALASVPMDDCEHFLRTGRDIYGFVKGPQTIAQIHKEVSLRTVKDYISDFVLDIESNQPWGRGIDVDSYREGFSVVATLDSAKAKDEAMIYLMQFKDQFGTFERFVVTREGEIFSATHRRRDQTLKDFVTNYEKYYNVGVIKHYADFNLKRSNVYRFRRPLFDRLPQDGDFATILHQPEILVRVDIGQRRVDGTYPATLGPSSDHYHVDGFYDPISRALNFVDSYKGNTITIQLDEEERRIESFFISKNPNIFRRRPKILDYMDVRDFVFTKTESL